MDYLPRATPEGWQAIEWQRLARPADAAVSIYARGRDYHKVLRARLQSRIEELEDRLVSVTRRGRDSDEPGDDLSDDGGED